MPAQAGVPWLSIVPIAESRSSYNGLLVFLFITSSAWLAPMPSIAWLRAPVRRAPPGVRLSRSRPGDAIFGGSFASRSAACSAPMPFAPANGGNAAAGDLGPARIEVTVHDLAWDTHLHPHRESGFRTAGRLDRLQF